MIRRRRLLVLRPLGLGDLLTAVPALRALARAHPFHEHVLAAPLQLSSLALLSGAVDRVVPARPLEPLPEECEGADLAIDLHGRGPGSHRVLLARHPQRLIAFYNAEVPETRGFPRWRDDEHEVDRWCRLLRESGIPADRGDLGIDPPPLEPPAVARGAIVVHPGAGYPARRWPADRWAAVTRSLGPHVVITGSAEERALALSVGGMAGIGAERILAGRSDILELAAIVASARLLISADTGIAHLATALGTPSVVLFGPSAPSRWGPPADRPWHRVLWKGRVGDPNGMRPDPGLVAITVEEVLDASSRVLNSPHAIRA